MCDHITAYCTTGMGMSAPISTPPDIYFYKKDRIEEFLKIPFHDTYSANST
ncbi:Uncharacterised protein [uncultured archaeon]|nr:Uncharacterised protein [uncultured archaeon]